jgi:hypothetical protein
MASISELSPNCLKIFGYGCKIDSLPVEQFDKVKLR